MVESKLFVAKFYALQYNDSNVIFLTEKFKAGDDMGKYENPQGKGIQPEKPKKRKMNIVLKTLLIIILILAVVVGIVAGILWSKLDLIEYDNEIDKSVYNSDNTIDFSDDEDELVDVSGLDILESPPEIADGELFSNKDVLNILLIGTDERTKEFNVNARSDSMIIVSIDKKNNAVKLVSLERGMAAPILEGVYEGKYDWLTHIFRYGGSELLTKTVEYMFKIDIDYYVRLNFNSVEQVIDAIGGITVELTSAEAWGIRSSLGLNYDEVTEGVNRLDGERALVFARLRKTDSDWKRVERQRKVILAVVDELQGASLSELNALCDIVLPLIQTDMSKMDIAQLVLYAPNFLSSTFDQMTIPQAGTYGGMRIMGDKFGFAPDYEINNALLYDFLYGDLE